MARGRKTSLTITLTPEERQTLLAWQRATAIQAGRRRRARMILLLAEGRSITAIAATVGISRRFVYKWAQRFLEQGVAGLVDRPGRGRRMRPAPPQEPYGLDAGQRQRVAGGTCQQRGGRRQDQGPSDDRQAQGIL